MRRHRISGGSLTIDAPSEQVHHVYEDIHIIHQRRIHHHNSEDEHIHHGERGETHIEIAPTQVRFRLPDRPAIQAALPKPQEQYRGALQPMPAIDRKLALPAPKGQSVTPWLKSRSASDA